mmetsp:Transcript_35170/g.75868  ORF Transcript_35170/g.75868 Transcript_35170/m.75868 type:complete len:202 (-) Transcript_35170:1594-2199(-)
MKMMMTILISSPRKTATFVVFPFYPFLLAAVSAAFPCRFGSTTRRTERNGFFRSPKGSRVGGLAPLHLGPHPPWLPRWQRCPRLLVRSLPKRPARLPRPRRCCRHQRRCVASSLASPEQSVRCRRSPGGCCCHQACPRQLRQLRFAPKKDAGGFAAVAPGGAEGGAGGLGDVGVGCVVRANDYGCGCVHQSCGAIPAAPAH